MPIEVELPDGQIAEFPDSMTPDQIQSVLRKQFGAQSPNDAPVVESQKTSSFDQARYDSLMQSNPQMAQAYAAQTTIGDNAKQKTEDRNKFLSELEQSNPDQAALIRDTSPIQAGLVGVGAGMMDVARGVGIADKDPSANQAIENLQQGTTTAGAGRLVGQAAPFLPLGVVASAPAALAARVAGGSLVGATEGGVIARGTGGSQSDVLAGIATGGLIGGGAEALLPFVNRGARALARKVKGAEPAGKLLDDMGRPTAELNSVLSEAGTTFEDLVKTSAEDNSGRLAEAFSKAGQKGRLDEILGRVSPDMERINAARSLGLDPEDIPMGVLTKDQAAQELAGALAAVPTSQASSALDQFSGRLGERADDYIREIGGSLDRAALSNDVLESMQADISRIKAVEDTLYDKIRANVSEGTLVNATPIKNVLSARARTRRGVKNLSAVERDVFDMVKDNKLTYANLDDKISEIGAALGRETDAYSTVQSSKLSDMYSKLSQLREGVAGTFGQAENLKKAKEIGAKRFGLQEASKNLYGKNLDRSIFPSVDSSVNRLSQGLSKEFESVMEMIPQEYRGQVLATSLNRALAGGSDQAQKLNATQFSKWHRNLTRNDAAYQSLKKYAPEGALDRLDALAKLSEGVSGVKAGRIRTGIVSDTFKRLDDTSGMVSKLFSAAEQVNKLPGGAIVSGPITAAGNAASLFAKPKTPAIEAADNLLSSSEFRKAFIAAADSGIDSAKYKSQAEALKNSKTYKNYLASLDKSVASTITAAGLIPWLTSKEDDK